VYNPIEINQPLHNPLKGWVLIDHALPGGQIDAGRSVTETGDMSAFEWYQDVAILSTWGEIEVEPDMYDWSLMDRSMAYWISVGKKIHLRLSTDNYGPHKGCPQWLYDMGVPSLSRPSDGTVFPDYSHPLYLQRLARFLEEYARHFFDNPNVETVDLRAYGNWGEWHSGYNYGTVAERMKALTEMIDTWRDVNGGRKFLNLSVSYEWQTPGNTGLGILPWGTSIYEEYRPGYRDYFERSAFDYALPLPDVTVRRDGVGGAVFQEYDGRLMANFFQHYRKPLFMEFFGGQAAYRGPSVAGFPNTKDGDDFAENALDEAISHHPNYISPLGRLYKGAIGFYNEDQNLIIKGHKLMG